jgi:hypothetical protein
MNWYCLHLDRFIADGSLQQVYNNGLSDDALLVVVTYMCGTLLLISACLCVVLSTQIAWCVCKDLLRTRV